MQRVRIYEFPEPTLDYPKIQSLKLSKFPRNKTQALLSWIRNEEEKQLWSGNTFRDELNEEVFLTHLERKDIRPFSFLGQRDELICYGEIVISPENNAVLCRVIVMPSLRRSGIGKKFIGEIIFDFNDVEKFFRYFQIKRNYRNVFNQIKTDFVYDLNKDKIFLNNVVVDNKSNKKINLFIEEYNKKEKNLFNKVTFRNFVKDFFKIYAG